MMIEASTTEDLEYKWQRGRYGVADHPHLVHVRDNLRHDLLSCHGSMQNATEVSQLSQIKEKVR
jgi:hypothetical protein